MSENNQPQTSAAVRRVLFLSSTLAVGLSSIACGGGKDGCITQLAACHHACPRYPGVQAICEQQCWDEYTACTVMNYLTFVPPDRLDLILEIVDDPRVRITVDIVRGSGPIVWSVDPDGDPANPVIESIAPWEGEAGWLELKLEGKDEWQRLEAVAKVEAERVRFEFEMPSEPGSMRWTASDGSQSPAVPVRPR